MSLYDIHGNVVSTGGASLPLAGKNVLFIGDSLTFGNMGTDPDTGGQLYPAKNYPQYFAEKTGCTVHNKSQSGANAVSYRDYIYPQIDFTVDYAVAIIMLGTNLGLADTYGEAYADIIEQLAKDTDGKTQIFLVTPPLQRHDQHRARRICKKCQRCGKHHGRDVLPACDRHLSRLRHQPV